MTGHRAAEVDVARVPPAIPEPRRRPSRQPSPASPGSLDRAPVTHVPGTAGHSSPEPAAWASVPHPVPSPSSRAGDRRRVSPGTAALRDAASRVPGVGLAELNARAELLTRVDRKYLVPLPDFAALMAELAPRLSALDIDGRRVFGYESVYFDTPGLQLFHDHLQGRRIRHKVRTRTYVDSELCLLEVKARGRRSQTLKQRRIWPVQRSHDLGAEGREFVRQQAQLGRDVAELRPVLVNEYRRATFVDLARGERLTADVDLRFLAPGRTAEMPDGHVLVETKSRRGRGAPDRILHRLGIREQSVSKYCVGICLLRDDVRRNPWHRVLHRYFDGPIKPADHRRAS